MSFDAETLFVAAGTVKNLAEVERVLRDRRRIQGEVVLSQAHADRAGALDEAADAILGLGKTPGSA